MTIDFNGPTCSCGNRGCWELYASEKALFQSLQTDGQPLTYQDIERLAKLNDMKTLNALRNFGFYIGVGLTNVLHTFNPQAVILRNKVIESEQAVLSVIQDEVSSRMDAQFSSRVELLPSSLGQNAPALGMTSLVTEAFCVMSRLHHNGIHVKERQPLECCLFYSVVSSYRKYLKSAGRRSPLVSWHCIPTKAPVKNPLLE